MISFKEFIQLDEGGNVQIGDVSAERIDLNKIDRDAITPEIEKMLDAFNRAFEAEHNIPIWSGELFKSKKFLSGSAFHFFDKAIATSEFKSPLSIATPCSVNAKGKYLIPPCFFEVLKLHLKLLHSSLVISNIKSGGNLFRLFLTVRFRYLVST